jgi:hypothetical protein
MAAAPSSVTRCHRIKSPDAARLVPVASCDLAPHHAPRKPVRTYAGRSNRPLCSLRAFALQQCRNEAPVVLFRQRE